MTLQPGTSVRQRKPGVQRAHRVGCHLVEPSSITELASVLRAGKWPLHGLRPPAVGPPAQVRGHRRVHAAKTRVREGGYVRCLSCQPLVDAGEARELLSVEGVGPIVAAVDEPDLVHRR